MVSSVLSMKKLKECIKDESGILGWLEDHSEFIHTFIPDSKHVCITQLLFPLFHRLPTEGLRNPRHIQNHS